MTHRERMERRADRLRGWAEKREQKASAQLNSFPEIRHDIAFCTQPGHIPFRARMIAADDRACESLQKAAGMESRADGIEKALDRSIYSDDEDAIEQLRERVATLEAERVRVKGFNASCRKGAPDWAFLTEKEAAGLKRTWTLCPYQANEKCGFPPYHLTNLSGNIKRNKDRLAQLEREKVTGPPLRQILVKYGGECATCGASIPKDTVAYYRKPDLFCETCRPGVAPVLETKAAIVVQ